MKNFAQLFTNLDQTTKTTLKVESLVDYFSIASDQDKMWAIAILSHRRPKRSVKVSLLREWAAELAEIPEWLFDESYNSVGDTAETIALVLPLATETNDLQLHEWIEQLMALYDKEEVEKKLFVLSAWSQMSYAERFVFNKLITGGFRVGVSQKLMMKALAKFTNQEENAIAHRLMGDWTPQSTTYEQLILSENILDDISRPYPFYLAYALETEVDKLGGPSDWQVERKWDGIRGQIIIRSGNIFVWSRGEELVTDKFPEYKVLVDLVPDGTVLDGEILPYKDGIPLSFNKLQTRIGRKNVTKKILEEVPVILMVYDILEYNNVDIREQALYYRRDILETMISEIEENSIIQISEKIDFSEWKTVADERDLSRQYVSEGLMLKRLDSPYRIGRKKGDWWKWKLDPLTIDAVMLYAQKGSGRRAGLYTDYTFAVWDGDNLVPFAKAYSGLKDVEFREITRWVNKHTKEKFGPVRSVVPELVFEIAFEGINASTRHKSGVALRFPRMLRWRKDKKVEEANTLVDLLQMLEQYG
jgi:DNA ligase-1